MKIKTRRKTQQSTKKPSPSQLPPHTSASPALLSSGGMSEHLEAHDLHIYVPGGGLWTAAPRRPPMPTAVSGQLRRQGAGLYTQPTLPGSEVELSTPDLWNCSGWAGPVDWAWGFVPLPPSCQLSFAGTSSRRVSSADALRPIVQGFLIPELGSSP